VTFIEAFYHIFLSYVEQLLTILLIYIMFMLSLNYWIGIIIHEYS